MFATLLNPHPCPSEWDPPYAQFKNDSKLNRSAQEYSTNEALSYFLIIMIRSVSQHCGNVSICHSTYTERVTIDCDVGFV